MIKYFCNECGKKMSKHYHDYVNCRFNFFGEDEQNIFLTINTIKYNFGQIENYVICKKCLLKLIKYDIENYQKEDLEINL